MNTPFSALSESFYSTRFYRSVQHWRARALVYLAAVLALCWIPSFYKAYLMMDRAIVLFQGRVLPQIPPIRFENGRVTTPQNRPYVIQVGQTHLKIIAIIDTSGKFTSLDRTDALFLLTRDKFFARQKAGDVRAYDLSKSTAKPMLIDSEVYLKILRFCRRWGFAGMCILIYFLSMVKRMVQAFFLALGGLLLVSLLSLELDLGELLSLAIVSMTPAMVIETLFALTGKSFRFQWILWLFLIFGYFTFAMNAASDKTIAEER